MIPQETEDGLEPICYVKTPYLINAAGTFYGYKWNYDGMGVLNNVDVEVYSCTK